MKTMTVGRLVEELLKLDQKLPILMAQDPEVNGVNVVNWISTQGRGDDVEPGPALYAMIGTDGGVGLEVDR